MEGQERDVQNYEKWLEANVSESERVKTRGHQYTVRGKKFGNDLKINNFHPEGVWCPKG